MPPKSFSALAALALLISCAPPPTGPYFPANSLPASDVEWFSKELANLRAPSLLVSANLPGPRYRMLYIDSDIHLSDWQTPQSILIAPTPKGRLRLTLRASGPAVPPHLAAFRASSPRARHQPPLVAHRLLTATEAAAFRAAASADLVCNARPDPIERGMDGDDRVFEYADDGTYCVAGRHVLRSGPLFALGHLMERLAAPLIHQ